MTHLYSCKQETHPDGDNYRITKFDAELNVESSYQIALDGSWCNCPAGERPTCRHRQMLPKFIARGAINSFWMYDYDRGGWVSMGADVLTGEDIVESASEMLSQPNSIADALRAANIPGVTVVDIGAGPEELYNTIADAVGEPRLSGTPTKPNRRGF